MAAGVVAALGEKIATEKQLTGWVNVPADCAGESGGAADSNLIHLHAARPAGVD